MTVRLRNLLSDQTCQRIAGQSYTRVLNLAAPQSFLEIMFITSMNQCRVSQQQASHTPRRYTYLNVKFGVNVLRTIPHHFDILVVLSYVLMSVDVPKPKNASKLSSIPSASKQFKQAQSSNSNSLQVLHTVSNLHVKYNQLLVHASPSMQTQTHNFRHPTQARKLEYPAADTHAQYS